ncbi:DUF6730 family protein [Gelidibacter pelagius]|nr:DUF6730 family protein [Gelidibacter pelagius]
MLNESGFSDAGSKYAITQLKETKIKMDLTEYKAAIEIHQQQMEAHLNSLERFQDHFDTKVKQAKIYPNWAVVVFIASVILGIGSLVLLLMYYV